MLYRTQFRLLFLSVLFVGLGCSYTPSRLEPPRIDASTAGERAIEQYDDDHDGKLNASELEKSPSLMAALSRLDNEGNREVTLAEIAARVKAWQRARAGRLAIMCVVLHNGKPLPDAEVKFVPESFLGDAITTGSGITDNNGFAMISIPLSGAGDPPGMPPGFYRIEISKGSETIPQKYNSNTTLGAEVALDAPGTNQALKFNLKY